jgi:hypothetical protein
LNFQGQSVSLPEEVGFFFGQVEEGPAYPTEPDKNDRDRGLIRLVTVSSPVKFYFTAPASSLRRARK